MECNTTLLLPLNDGNFYFMCATATNESKRMNDGAFAAHDNDANMAIYSFLHSFARE